MAKLESDVEDAIMRLKFGDTTLETIYLFTDYDYDSDDDRNIDRTEEISELIDCLLNQPNIIKHLELDDTLTDEDRIKLCRFVGVSSTIESIMLHEVQSDSLMFFAMADALKTNVSLRHMYIRCKQTKEEKARTDAAFIESLRINPNRPIESKWEISYDCPFKRFQAEAMRQGHTTMQKMLCVKLDQIAFQLARHF